MKYRVVVALVILGFTASSALPQVPAGPEFQVNVFTTNNQSRASVASDRSGNFVVAWESHYQQGTSLGVFARRYDASGMPLGAEFQVNTYTTGNQESPAVAIAAAGNFVIVWQSDQDGSGAGIFGQRYDASGTRLGSEFQVNAYTANLQGSPSVASAPSGSFVVTWHSDGQDGSGHGVFAQRHAASGARLGAEFRVNTYTFDDQYQSAVASDAAGNFIVAWTSDGQDGNLSGVFAQRYAASGAPRGAEFQVNEFTFWYQEKPSVAPDGAGNFVVAWSLCYFTDFPFPRFQRLIFGRRYDASGAPRGSEFLVSYSSALATQCIPAFSSSVASDEAGGFVVASDVGQYYPSNFGVTARRYDASGAPRGAVFTVNTYPPDNASKNPSISSDAAGNVVVVWENISQDGDSKGVFGQRFGGIQPVALAVDTAASAGSDGNRVLEPGEFVDVRPSWRNVNGAAQTFDANILSFSGPPANGVSYPLLDGVGAYGTVASGATAPCSDCYQVAVTFGGTRPSLHWDGTFTERLTPDVLGQTKPWSIHVGESFSDVPKTSLYYRVVETLLHEGVTAGCGSGAYCPGSPTTREQVAAFVLLAKEGAGYAPLACSPPNLFADVPETSIFCDVIEELARRGVVGGCGSGNYCPTSPVTREQMAIFVLRTLDPFLSPPACTTPVFADVPATSPFCPWIEELARRGVVAGCGGGNYCPTSPVTREQMAVFLTGTFGLTLYGP